MSEVQEDQGLVWEDPPISKNKKYLRLLEPLTNSPGTWARIGTYSSPSSAAGTVSHLRKRRYSIPLPEDEWEFQASENKVWGRYLGHKNGHKDHTEEV